MNNEEQFKDALRNLVESKQFPVDENNWEKVQQQLSSGAHVAESSEELLFKDTLQNLVESKEFPFDQSNWNALASTMPETGRSRNKKVLYAVPLLLLLLSGFFTYIFFETPGTAKPSSLTKKPENNGTPERALKSSNNVSPLKPVKTAAKLHSEPAGKPDLKTMAGSFLASKEKSKTTAPRESNVISETEKVLQSAETKAKDSPIPTASKRAAEPADHKQKVITETNARPAELVNHTVTKESAQQLPEANRQPEESTKTGSSASGYTSTTENAGIAGNEKRDQPNSIAATDPQPAVTPLPASHLADTETQAPVKGEDQQLATPAAPEPLKEIMVAKPDSAVAAISNSMSPWPAIKKIIMSFEAGADYLAGWKNPGKKDAGGFNPVIGFNYYNYLSDKLAVSFGAQFTTVANLSYYSHVSKVTHYDLGAQSSVTVITPQKLYYLAIPVKIKYFINEKNSFGAGINVGYLLSSSSKVETYDESFGTQTNRKTYKGSGYTEGFAAFDARLCVFYRRKIYKNLSLNAELMYGLTDIKSNGFFNSNLAERNSGVRLTLLYNIFK